MNSTRLALFALIAGLVAGIGAGFVLGSKAQDTVSAADTMVDRTGTIDRVSSGRAVDTGGATGDLAHVSAQAAPLPGVASDDGAYDGATRGASKAALGRVAAGLSSMDRSSWTGTITGTVLDADGNVLAGVTIVTSNGEGRNASRSKGTKTSATGRAYSGPTDVDSALDERAKSLLRSRRERLTTTSDTTGQFSFGGLRPGSHTLSAYHDGLIFKPQSVHTGESARFIGQPVALFHLDIRLPDGTAPDEATVLVGEQRRPTAYYWSQEEPILRLEEQTATMTVLAGNVVSSSRRQFTSDYSATDHTIDLARDGEGPHTIEVKTRRVLRVTLEDVSGLEPRLKAWVKIVKARHAEGDDLGAAFADAKSLTRGDGVAFTVSDLDAGAYVLGAGRGDGAPEVSTSIELGDGISEEHLVLGELDMGRFLIVHCSGPGGKQLFGVSFQRRLSLGNGSSSGGVTAISRGPGTYWISHGQLMNGRVWADGWADDTELQLTADARGYGKITSELSEGQETLTLDFQSSCELTVHVSGDITPGFSISAEVVKDDKDNPSRSFGGNRNSKRVNGEGVARLTGLQPGLMRVSLRKANDHNRGWLEESVASQEIMVRAGSNEVAFVAPTFHDVAVYAPDHEKGASFMLQRTDVDSGTYWGRSNVELDATLRATFKDVVAGEYTLRTWASGTDSQMKISVPTAEVLFQPGIINAYTVSSVEAGKLGDKGGLQKGDIVVAINGKEFEGSGFYQRLALDLKDGAVSLSVQRGSRAMTISIGPAETKTNPWEEVGVSWEPTTR